MLRIAYIIALITGVALFNSCCNGLLFSFHKPEPKPTVQEITSDSVYGSYLAGRVAHIRQDFNTAADFYMNSLEKDPKNQELLNKIYVILASQGRIHEAAEYSKKAIESGDKNNFTYIIISVDEMKEKKYSEVHKTLKNLDGNVYKEFINPLISAWAYAGEGNKEKALKTIAQINKEPSFRAIYHFHAGMINDYFDDMKEAERFYGYIIKNEKTEMSFRSLQVITNFYLRNNQKDKAIELISKYGDDKLFIDMLKNLATKIQDAEPDKTPKLITGPDIGVAEALFSISATLRQGAPGVDLAHIFICLSIYSNPDYDLSKLLLADILESRGQYEDANLVYDEITNKSEAYYTAQVKKATNLALLKDYKSAELLLKSLALTKKNDPQLYLDLGDILRLQGKFKESIKYYKLSIEALPKVEDQHWVLFYSLGSAYERNDQWNDAEIQFRVAAKMSQNHFLVLNYLGYSLIKHNQNIEEAFGMIVDSYNQAPQDGNIADSLGWAFYKLGMYEKAITYLERASEIEPANAVIYDHLGDALWMIGRRNEARYQWSHALKAKDDNNEINKEEIDAKLEKGLQNVTPVSFDEEAVKEKIKEIIKNQ